MLAPIFLGILIGFSFSIIAYLIIERRKLKASIVKLQSRPQSPILQVGKVDPFTQEDQDLLSSYYPALESIDKWLSFLVARKLEELNTLKTGDDFLRAQWASQSITLLLSQIRTLTTKAKRKMDEEKKKSK